MRQPLIWSVQTPAGWELVERSDDGGAYRHPSGLMAIVSAAVEDDSRRWLHISLSRRNRLPDYTDLVMVKEAFIGDAYAVMILPPRRVHVNLHPFCLHLFHCLDGHPLPEFSKGGLTL